MKTPVERLRDDLLFKALTSGTATQDDARDAAKWIERLTAAEQSRASDQSARIKELEAELRVQSRTARGQEWIA